MNQGADTESKRRLHLYHESFHCKTSATLYTRFHHMQKGGEEKKRNHTHPHPMIWKKDQWFWSMDLRRRHETRSDSSPCLTSTATCRTRSHHVNNASHAPKPLIFHTWICYKNRSHMTFKGPFLPKTDWKKLFKAVIYFLMFPGKVNRQTVLPSKNSPGLKLSHGTIGLTSRK